MEIIVGVVAGVVVVAFGALALGVALRGRARPEVLEEAIRHAVDEQRRQATEERDAAVRAAVEHMLVQNQALMRSEQALVGQELDSKKSLIDARLHSMGDTLTQVTSRLEAMETQRVQRDAELREQLSLQQAGVTSLVQTTQSLREALSSTKARGQWGERMAEDVLRLAGFVENVNYRKQRALEQGSGIPDFTFLLPNELLLHMDVKFPFDNYVRYCDAGTDLDRKRAKDDFLRDVRNRVKELSGREYVDAGGSTVDFVLCFIPNEQLYGFIHEHDGALLDEALRQRVVFCSPLTLFAVLALIRQMVENFQLARTSDEILSLLGQFGEQWKKFVGQMDKVGTRIEAAGREYETLVGTRKKMLERPLHKIEVLRSQQGGDELELVDDDEDPTIALEA